MFVISVSSLFSDTGCCTVKKAGGVVYEFLTVGDTSSYDCLDNCIYTIKDSPGTQICFQAGDTESTCIQ